MTRFWHFLPTPVCLLLCAAAPPARDDKAPVGAKDAPDVVAAALLDAHNRERAGEKLPPLALDPALGRAADGHADDMASHHKMTHEGSDGSTPFDRIKKQGYHYQSAGENVAEGWRRVDEVMKGWLDSPPHKANILGKFTRVGFAVALDDAGAPYWCADFATPYPSLDPGRAAADLLAAVNKARVAAEKPKVAADAKLSTVAARLARVYARAEGAQPPKAPAVDLAAELKEAEYRFLSVGVTVASGQPTADEVLATWMKDKGNREAVLGAFVDAGVGIAEAESGRPYWCIVLAKPAGR